MTPMLSGLSFKGQKEIVVLNAPETFARELDALDGVTIHRDVTRLKRVECVVAFVMTDAEIANVVENVLLKAPGDPLVYLAYPKGTSKRYRCEFDRRHGWAPVIAAGFDSTQQVALDEDWSILRFRRREHVVRTYNAAKLLELRNQREWNQAELARRADVAQNYISKLERNRVDSPNVLHLQKIAEALDVPLGTLLNLQGRTLGLKVFICHGRSDQPAVRHLYRRLKAEGYLPWLDEEDLLPGWEWEKEISRALSEAHVAIICLSADAVTKRGFVQKEIDYAIAAAREQPERTIYIIPARLEECPVPDRLAPWHWVNLFEPRGFNKLLRSLRHRAGSLQGTAESGGAWAV
ncbi:TIR domain-containing protein [Longimicrobium sp.]|uniref:TIR domain-containing protein n=1 Tax=Longimicrobium sp. TaxID=2029185 RepID=UPI003B3A6723